MVSDKGSEFVIRLPVATANRASTASERASARHARSAMRTGRRILVVDDNIDGARLTAEALESVGHDTRVAFDGPGALEIAAAFSPDVALLDLGLAADGWLRACAATGRGPPEKEPLLVAVTGYGQASDHERTRRRLSCPHGQAGRFRRAGRSGRRLLAEERAG